MVVKLLIVFMLVMLVGRVYLKKVSVCLGCSIVLILKLIKRVVKVLVVMGMVVSCEGGIVVVLGLWIGGKIRY